MKYLRLGPTFAKWLRELTPEDRKKLLEHDKEIKKECARVFKAASKLIKKRK